MKNHAGRPFLFVLWFWALAWPAQAGTIAGLILDKDSKAPVAGACLILQPSVQVSPSPTPVNLAFTDASGNFRCSVPDGLYRYVIRAEGFKDLSGGPVSLTRDGKENFFLVKLVLKMPEVVVTTEKVLSPQVSRETLTKE